MKLDVNSNADLCPKANSLIYIGFMDSGACGNFKKVSEQMHRYREQTDGCQRGWRLRDWV